MSDLKKGDVVAVPHRDEFGIVFDRQQTTGMFRVAFPQTRAIECLPVQALTRAPAEEAREFVADNLRVETRAAVAALAVRLEAKLLAAQFNPNYTDAWDRVEWADELRYEMLKHVLKGDPVDVAGFCAFALARGWSTAPSPQAIGELVRVAIERARGPAS